MAESAIEQEPLSRTLTGSSENLFNYVCQPCSVDSKTIQAVGFCVTCTELLCDECFRCHLKPTQSRNHKLLGLEEAKRDQNFACSSDLLTETCNQHPQEISEYFCGNHDTRGCSACMKLEHRTSDSVQYVPKVVEAVAHGQEYSGLIQELDNVLLRTKRLIKESTENKAKLQNLCDRVLDNVRKIKKDVTEAFEKLESEMKTEAEMTKSKQIQQMDENIVVFDAIQQRAEKLIETLKSMKTNGQYCKLYIAMTVENIDIKSLNAKLDKAANDNAVADFQFQPCKEIEELLQLKDSLGNICLQARGISYTANLGKQVQKDSDTSIKPTSIKVKPESKPPHDNVKHKATKVGEINVKTNDDAYKCSIVGLVSLPKGRLVAADNYNDKVKLIDVHRARVVSALDVLLSPFDMTATDEPLKIAVALGTQKKILIVNVTEDSMLKDREIKLPVPVME